MRCGSSIMLIRKRSDFMKRDKIISIRVNSDLYNAVLKRIESKTRVYSCWRSNFYEYRDGIRMYFRGKFTVADLLEEKFREYLEETSSSAEK